MQSAEKVKHFNQTQLAERWDVAEATLERWRSDGIGPVFMKIQGRVLYRVEDIETFESDSLRQSTSSAVGGVAWTTSSANWCDALASVCTARKDVTMDSLKHLETPLKPRGTTWTPDDVSARFYEAAVTARRLPPVRVQGYFNCWPAFARSEWEAFSADEPVHRSLPPSPEDIDRMLETMRWVQWLEVEQRHLVWMRAARYRWYDIGKRFGCAPRTAQRRWEMAMYVVAHNLTQGISVR